MIVVITGATSGIGLAVSQILSEKGYSVIGIGRDIEKCKECENKIKNSVYLCCDLSLQRNIKKLSEDIKRISNNRIHALINNAGTVSSWYQDTLEGIELQFAVNHLASFYLTHLLYDSIEDKGKVITISSRSHYHTRMNWNDIMSRKRYGCLKAYKRTKLANVLFAYELRNKAKGRIYSYAVDPGLVNTDIGLKGTSGIVSFIWKKRSRKGSDPKTGAATAVYLVCNEADNSFVYWKYMKPKKPSLYSMKKEHSIKLWEISERMCNIKSSELIFS